MINLNKLVTLNKLAKKLNLNKSRLSYYVSLGLLKPEATIGRMMLFDERGATQKFKWINKRTQKGDKLKDLTK
jgi:DNA-binding transcriptional MerR regulator